VRFENSKPFVYIFNVILTHHDKSTFLLVSWRTCNIRWKWACFLKLGTGI